MGQAYHLGHSTENTSHPIRAIALLQTPSHALDLRPENKLALDNSQMTPGHEDLLTADELPEDPETLSKKLKGIVLVDHGSPLRKWSNAKILSIFDHHKDRDTAPDAEPRVFEVVASCTTLVARQMLDELEKLDQEYHMPHELLELILSAIAIDSGGLTSDKTKKTDIETSKRILARSAWAKKDLEDVMEDLDDELSSAQKDIGGFDLRDLLRRDWKGDLIDTPSPRTPTVSLGFASIPFSMDEQILKTDFAELFDWFAVHAVRFHTPLPCSTPSTTTYIYTDILRPGPPKPASTSPSPSTSTKNTTKTAKRKNSAKSSSPCAMTCASTKSRLTRCSSLLSTHSRIIRRALSWSRGIARMS